MVVSPSFFGAVEHLVTTVPDVDPNFADAAESLLEHFTPCSQLPLEKAEEKLRFLIPEVEKAMGWDTN